MNLFCVLLVFLNNTQITSIMSDILKNSLTDDIRYLIRDFLEPTQVSILIKQLKEQCVFQSEIMFQEFEPGFYRDWKLHEHFNKTRNCYDCNTDLVVGATRYTNVYCQPNIYCRFCYYDNINWAVP